jgi:hypothetical protein
VKFVWVVVSKRGDFNLGVYIFDAVTLIRISQNSGNGLWVLRDCMMNDVSREGRPVG